ncbi:uncharacterized protein LOC115719429 isoform X2 [Cannabis sativa]|uniref:uncharacterized protein LOC115719429 isoform X2 n=1 Tax=Cannabis sativa TaxID=3483 RepID=UPI0029C9D08F|nr:uncharacterized protein LOC115719429 isoform X2 [Cannabis sativa]
MKALHFQYRLNPTTTTITTTPQLPFYPSLSPSPFLLLLPLPTHTHFPSLHSKSQFSSSSSSAGASMSMAASTETDTDTKPFSVLFVCLGNICRSPAAEGVFTDLVKKRGLESKFKIDSAGTINYHEGSQADPRMRGTAKSRGIRITSLSRPIRPSDFVDFDLILAMDNQNKDDIIEAFNRWKFKDPLPEDAHNKVKLMCSYCKRHDETEVPDPYYGGQEGFDKVLDILEDACESLLDSILAENKNI